VPCPATTAFAVEWDNAPEQMINAALVGSSDFRFAGYKVYRLDDWHRESELPEPERWQQLAAYRADPSQGGKPLANIIDPTIPPDGTGPGGPHYPVGRYHIEDDRAFNGFDYHYVVTTILRGHPNGAIALPAVEYESPFAASFDERVVPHTGSRAASGAVWVVPNPYRANSSWERQPGAGRCVHPPHRLHGPAEGEERASASTRWPETWCRRSTTTARTAMARRRGT
jgi:hypothetical protein